MDAPRLAIDIGGTFTDLAVAVGSKRFSTKVLTTPRTPEEGVLAGIDALLRRVQWSAADCAPDSRHHACHQRDYRAQERQDCARCHPKVSDTLLKWRLRTASSSMTSSWISRSSWCRASCALGYPSLDGRGNVWIPLDETAVRRLAPVLQGCGVEAVAIGYMHADLDGRHERHTREILAGILPGTAFTLSSKVSPEIREYEHWSTAVANAYVQPVMDRYLGPKSASSTMASSHS
jgi:N-methylhydantoinase A